jgi:BON domain-containing protein
MMEPFFGSNPLPPGVPSPGFGWFQLPLSLTNRPPINPGAFSAVPNVSLAPQTVAQPMSQEGYGYGGGPAAATSGFMSQSIAPAAFGVGTPVPGFSIPEIATVQGLLAMVAVRRGQPMGPTSDNEIEEFVYDAFEFLPSSTEVEVRCEGGRATLTGSVPHKRLKRDVGEIVWAIPAINDVQNNVTITARRRRAQTREAEASQPTARKQG